MPLSPFAVQLELPGERYLALRDESTRRGCSMQLIVREWIGKPLHTLLPPSQIRPIDDDDDWPVLVVSLLLRPHSQFDIMIPPAVQARSSSSKNRVVRLRCSSFPHLLTFS
jgi:hypothetical protein